MSIPNIGKIKNVPSHQPDIIWVNFFWVSMEVKIPAAWFTSGEMASEEPIRAPRAPGAEGRCFVGPCGPVSWEQVVETGNGFAV